MFPIETLHLVLLHLCNENALYFLFSWYKYTDIHLPNGMFDYERDTFQLPITATFRGKGSVGSEI